MEEVTDEEFTSALAQDKKAVTTGIKDGFLTILFQAVGQLLAYVVTLLPLLDTLQDGKYSWVKVPVGIAIGAVIKAIDRKRHEDTSSSTGLVEI